MFEQDEQGGHHLAPVIAEDIAGESAMCCWTPRKELRRRRMKSACGWVIRGQRFFRQFRGLFSAESVASPLLAPGNDEKGNRQPMKSANG